MPHQGSLFAVLHVALALTVPIAGAHRSGRSGCEADCKLGNVTNSCNEQITQVMRQSNASSAEACTSAYGHVLTECKTCADCSLAYVDCHIRQSLKPTTPAGPAPAPGAAGKSAEEVKERIAALNSKLKDLDQSETQTEEEAGQAKKTFTVHPDADKGEAQKGNESKLHERHVNVTWKFRPKTVVTTSAKPKPQPSQAPPPAPLTGGCNVVCKAQGYAATCKDHVNWVSKHVLKGDPDRCISAYAKVLAHCKDCNECSFRDTGCISPGVPTTLPPTTKSPPKAAAPVKNTGGDADESKPAYNCKEGVEHWESWPKVQQAWCCSNEGEGCSENAYDCQDQSDAQHLWTKGKKIWCCRHQPSTCDTVSTSGPPLKLWSSDPSVSAAVPQRLQSSAALVACAAVSALALFAAVRVYKRPARGLPRQRLLRGQEGHELLDVTADADSLHAPDVCPEA